MPVHTWPFVYVLGITFRKGARRCVRWLRIGHATNFECEKIMVCATSAKVKCLLNIGNDSPLMKTPVWLENLGDPQRPMELATPLVLKHGVYIRVTLLAEDKNVSTNRVQFAFAGWKKGL